MMSNVIDLNAWRHNLQMGSQGPKKNITNLMVHLRNLPGLGKTIRFNEQTQQPEWNGRPIEDHDFIDIRMIIEQAGFQPNDKDVRPGVMRLAQDHKYNPVRDYLDGLKWDGKPRIDHWLHRLMGAADTDFVRSISPKVLISAVARIYQPGCQVDTMLVLEGAQGVRKSSAVQVLFGHANAYEVVSSFENHKQLAMSIMGAWGVELAEFVSVSKSHAGSVKGLISMRTDRVVLPYGRALSDLPRRCVFIGTINPGAMGYLTDDTGNRRYWPVTVTKVDLDKLADHRDQMWAEAVHRYRGNEPWWLSREETALAEEVQADREEDEPWLPILSQKLMGINETTTDAAMAALGIDYEKRSRVFQMRAATVLKRLGYARMRARMGPDRVPSWVWRRMQ